MLGSLNVQAFAIGCGSVQLVGRRARSDKRGLSTYCVLAAIDGRLGQHQTVKSDGQPLLNDPRFAIYEKVSKMPLSLQ